MGKIEELINKYGLDTLRSYAKGGKIHIKPENRGKFTALKKRTGHSASWFKAHGTPAQRKMAVFELNSRKWKHADGGVIDRLRSVFGKEALAAVRRYAGGGPLFDPEGKFWTGPTEPEVSSENGGPVSAIPIKDHRAFAIEDIKRRLITQENEHRKGWDPIKKVWKSYPSEEGGADTIAYGIKLSNGSPWSVLALKQGYLTDRQAKQALHDMANSYYDAAAAVYNDRYGDAAWEMLNGKERSFLTDYQYNVKNGGLKKFPNLMQAMHDGDVDAVIRESSRTYTDKKGNVKPLKKRNAAMVKDADSLRFYYPHGYYFTSEH